MASNSKYVSNSTLGLGPKKVNKVSLPILQCTFSRVNATPIQNARVIENNLAKPQLLSKKKRRATSEPLEESKEIAGIDSQPWESASPLYKTLSIQGILPLYQPGSLPALYQPGSLASTSQGGIPFSKPSPDRQVAPGSPGPKENLAKANPGFVDIKDNPGFFERNTSSLMLKPLVPTNPSNIPMSPPGDLSLRKADPDAVLHMDASFHEPSSSAIPQIKEAGKAPLSLSSSEASEKEIGAPPQLQNLGKTPVVPAQMEPVENGAVIASFSQAAPIFTDREQSSRHLSPVDPIFNDKEKLSGEKPQVESPALIIAAAAKKESVLLPQSEPLIKIPAAEISKFEIGPKSGLLTISQAKSSHPLPDQTQISDPPIQNTVTVEKLDLRSAIDSSGKQQISIQATVEKQNTPASLHLPIQPAETQRPLATSAPPPTQPIKFLPMPKEMAIAASLHLDSQTPSAAPEPVRLNSALPIHSSPRFIPSYSAAQPRPIAPVERNHEEPSSLTEVEKVDVEQPVKRDQILSEERIVDVSNVAEPTITHTANLMENLDPIGPSSLSEKSVVIEQVHVEPSAPPEWTFIHIQPVMIYSQPATYNQPTYNQPATYNQPFGEIKIL